MIDDTIEYLQLTDLTPKNKTDKKVEFDLTQNQYAKIYTLLDRNESDWNEDSEELDNSDEDIIQSNYYSKKGTLELRANLDKDTYTITIEETK